jgi:phosphoenolpyruvate carboxylase
MVWPPITMATQHPDNAGAPWWRDQAFIPVQDELEELLMLFEHLPIDEYMWDWEGKHVDEGVGEKLYARAANFFEKRPLGQNLHFTYRIPAYDDGRSRHRMARAFMNVLSLSDLSRELQLPQPPVTEMFLPLTTRADQPMAVRKLFLDIAEYHRRIFRDDGAVDTPLLSRLAVTPLIEDVPSLLTIENIVGPYWDSLVKEKVDLSERGLRVFLARSDPALNAGLVPAVLALKIALSTIRNIGTEMKVQIHPIIGTGSLPFRGSVNPQYLDTFLQQYAGVRTYSIQSGFRYDYGREEVVQALKRIKQDAPRLQAVQISDADKAELIAISNEFSSLWQPAIEQIAPVINQLAKFVPPRRERLQHIGLFGYSRGIGKVQLPRAIGFTAALYSLGVPPEFITMGRGLKAIEKQGRLSLLQTYYPALNADLQHAGKYLNRENLAELATQDTAFAGIQEDVQLIEKILGLKLGPEKPHHLIHRNLTSTIFQRWRAGDVPTAEMQHDVVQAGVIRRSIG